jgi:penicillin amidase
MTYEDITSTGSTYPGIPNLVIAKTPYVAWGVTSSRTDLSDLYREELSEDGSKYLVDGEWREIQVIKERVQCKGKPEGVDLQIRLTHRGPLIDTNLLQKVDGL